MIKIGIDLATKQTGICFMNGEKVLRSVQVQMVPWGENENKSFLSTNFKIFYNWLYECFNIFSIKNKDIIVGIELGNFSNPKHTQRFAFYAGMLFVIFTLICKKFECNINDFKTFNASSWRKLWREEFNLPNINDRDIWKEYSLKIAFEKKGQFFNNDDESDAYWIAYYSDKCLSSEISEVIKSDNDIVDKKIKKIKNKNSLLAIQIKGLKKIGNLSQLKKLEERLIKNENKIKVLKEGVR